MIQLLKDFANGWIKWISFNWNRSDCEAAATPTAFLKRLLWALRKLWLAKGEVSISGLPVQANGVHLWCGCCKFKVQ